MKTGTFRTLSIGIASVMLALTGYRAQASFYTVGGPVDVGSWGPGATWFQQWGETGVGNFDQIEAIARPSSSIFASPGLGSFLLPPAPGSIAAAGWQDYDVDATHAVAAGPSISGLLFDTYFTANPSMSLTFDLYAWNGNTLADSVRATWNGSTWSYGTADPNVTRTVVPEPTTLLLAPLGLLALRLVRKNRVS